MLYDFGKGVVLVKMDNEPVMVKNTFDESKQCLLCPAALALYDFIKGCEVMIRMGDERPTTRAEMVYALHKFSEEWPEEYMILLD
jgi:hypothetical protein